MKKLMAKCCSGYKTTAKVVEDTLILSCPDALSPVVWRMDLSRAQAAALEVRDGIKGKKGEGFTLVLKAPNEEVQEIAPFATRAQAVTALMAASRAMENAPVRAGQAGPVTGDMVVAGKGRTGGGGRWLAALAGIVLLVGVFAFLIGTTPQGETFPTESGVGGTGATASGPAGGAAGVPLSADEFLRSRR